MFLLVNLLLVAAVAFVVGPAVERYERQAIAPPEWAKVSRRQITEARKYGVPVAFENELGMRFVLIPAGTFLMGSPPDEEGRNASLPWRRRGRVMTDSEIQHEVTLSSPYYLSTTEITQAMYASVTGESPSAETGENLPLTHVSWEDCQALVRRLNERLPGRRYRIPTEAEWEHACRAGNPTAWCFGTEQAELTKFAWCAFNSRFAAHPVGGLQPNAWGLFDMHGNVAEWCADPCEPYTSDPVTDPLHGGGGGLYSGNRVVRGGYFAGSPSDLRSASRKCCRPGGAGETMGVRLAASPLAETE